MKTRNPGAVTRRSVLGAGLVLAAHGTPAAFGQSATADLRGAGGDEIETIAVTSRPITAFARTSNERTFGRLSFRGGMVLTSQAANFGGLSGLVMDTGGRDFLAVSDEGHWLSGQLTYDGQRPAGMARTRMGPLRAKTGAVLQRKRDKDCEAIALEDGTLQRGTVLLAFERLHRIGRFPIVDGIIGAPRQYLTMPPEVRSMSGNRGFEAMCVIKGGPYRGAVIALSERFGGEDVPHVGWMWIEGVPRRFNFTDVAGFEITDMVSLEDGSLIVLERRFRWTEGVKMQLRLVPAADVRPGGLLAGEVLFSGGLGYEIDNMEALGLHREASGAAVLTLLSDDNFNSFLQRTLLLQFTLAGV